MAILAVQKPGLAGAAPTFAAAAAGGDSFPNDGQTLLHVKNGHTAAQTVTADAVSACSFGFDHDAAVSVPAGGERVVGPFPQGRFGTSVALTYSGVTALTVAAIAAS